MKKLLLLLLLPLSVFAQTTLPTGSKLIGNIHYQSPAGKVYVFKGSQYLPNAYFEIKNQVTIDSLLALKASASTVATNTANIATNTTNIAGNTSNIASNTSAIALKVDKVTGKSLVFDTEITRLGTLSNYTADTTVLRTVANSLTKAQVQTQLNLKAPESGSANYIQNNGGSPQTANLVITGKLVSRVTDTTYPYMQVEQSGIYHYGSATQNAQYYYDRIIYRNNSFNQSFFSTPSLTADRSIYLPDASGTVALRNNLTTTQRDALVSPAEGTEIYNLTTHTKEFFNGTVWKTVTTN